MATHWVSPNVGIKPAETAPVYCGHATQMLPSEYSLSLHVLAIHVPSGPPLAVIPSSFSYPVAHAIHEEVFPSESAVPAAVGPYSLYITISPVHKFSLDTLPRSFEPSADIARLFQLFVEPTEVSSVHVVPSVVTHVLPPS